MGVLYHCQNINNIDTGWFFKWSSPKKCQNLLTKINLVIFRGRPVKNHPVDFWTLLQALDTKVKHVSLQVFRICTEIQKICIFSSELVNLWKPVKTGQYSSHILIHSPEKCSQIVRLAQSVDKHFFDRLLHLPNQIFITFLAQQQHQHVMHARIAWGLQNKWPRTLDQELHPPCCWSSLLCSIILALSPFKNQCYVRILGVG